MESFGISNKQNENCDFTGHFVTYWYVVNNFEEKIRQLNEKYLAV